MPNVYLFRNVITSKVLVSPQFRMPDRLLSQIGEQRSQLKIRGDHWVPFAVLTGLRDVEACKRIVGKIASGFKHPKGFYRLPLPPPKLQNGEQNQFAGWRIPEEVRNKTKLLCNVLSDPQESWVSENEQAVQEPDADGLLSLESENQLCIHWERDEFKNVVENPDDWPSFVDHKHLKLIRNRFPIVPEFDNKLRDDTYVTDEPLEQVHSYLKTRKIIKITETSKTKSWTRASMKAGNEQKAVERAQSVLAYAERMKAKLDK